MNRMTRLKTNLQVLGRYCSARAALYGCSARDAVEDLEHVTVDGGRTLITAEYWAELHGTEEYDELLQRMAGCPMSVILRRRKVEDEAVLKEMGCSSTAELIERLGSWTPVSAG
jgi:hypothetical protein